MPQILKFGGSAARMPLANEVLFKKWNRNFWPRKLTLFCAADNEDLSSRYRDHFRELYNYWAIRDHVDLTESGSPFRGKRSQPEITLAGTPITVTLAGRS
jgi:hypothetical protein